MVFKELKEAIQGLVLGGEGDVAGTAGTAPDTATP